MTIRSVVLLTCLFTTGMFQSIHAESLVTLAKRADLSCVDFHTVGVCRRATPPYVGIRVRYRQPVLLIETVKIPGHVVIDELRGLVEQTFKSPGRSAIADASDSRAEPDSGGGFNDDTTSVQMNDVHVYGFPLTDQISALIEAPCEGSPDLGGSLSYMSELDAAEWRTARFESGHPMARLMRATGVVCGQPVSLPSPGMCMGSWGPLFPRTGQLAHYSETVASAATAYRAVDIASLNMVVPHRVIIPSMFSPNMISDRLQMVSPKATMCLRIGEDPQVWENNRRSEDGNYVWIYWRQKECCLF